MSNVLTIREKLDYLVRKTGRTETELVAEAVEEGLTELYRKHVADAYLAGELRREEAAAMLGREALEDLDYARRAVEHDVAWGMRSG